MSLDLRTPTYPGPAWGSHPTAGKGYFTGRRSQGPRVMFDNKDLGRPRAEHGNGSRSRSGWLE